MLQGGGKQLEGPEKLEKNQFCMCISIFSRQYAERTYDMHLLSRWVGTSKDSPDTWMHLWPILVQLCCLKMQLRKYDILFTRKKEKAIKGCLESSGRSKNLQRKGFCSCHAFSSANECLPVSILASARKAVSEMGKFHERGIPWLVSLTLQTVPEYSVGEFLDLHDYYRPDTSCKLDCFLPGKQVNLGNATILLLSQTELS